ncbi:Kef-type potassium/proton antiporter, CPA2 family [Mariprofundus ferrinatatus]|uniref:Kef-type potassium/proton antiporter, CPA2 family n=1 Tax=Mariprofundus ferrinatatus TaxID=1921087 RepID=A0A2K8L9X9_9PROT|nr:cation:proton antiporter [Mariprofundus ferrinatatus]ATX83059.1 Kef-type potassium/proton antiporter, CPA2 family [Mariprofundus ferrinatatus]
MDYSYLNEALIILLAAVSVVTLFLRIGLPPIIGYLVAGLMVGPFGIGLISDVEHIKTFAEFGVVFLLFTIGLEFSISLLIRMKGTVLGLGGAQVFVTTAAATAIAYTSGIAFVNALVLGGVVAMSSTALVTKQLVDQVELHTRHGRNSLGILLFQDMMVVPFLILVASMSRDAIEPSLAALLIIFAEGVLVLGLIFVLGRWVLQPLFHMVAHFRSAELFTLTVLLVVICSSWLTHAIGLTFALGAFLAGVMLSETEFRHQVESEIRPFRDVLLGLFFITVGMMLNTGFLPEVWPAVLLLLVGLVICKLLLIGVLCRLSGWNSAVSMRTGLILAHGGEFGFAILLLAMDGGLLDSRVGQTMLAAMILSMALAPLVIRYNGLISTHLMPAAAARSRQEIKEKIMDVSREMRHHVIVCGFGRVGQHSASMLDETKVAYMAIDLDSGKVQEGMAQKRPVSYGDAGSLELLHACGLKQASALLITIIDFNTAMKIISRVRPLYPDLPIIVRTRKEMHLYQLYQAGASEVVADTFGSDQMLTREMLRRFKLGQ